MGVGEGDGLGVGDWDGEGEGVGGEVGEGAGGEVVGEVVVVVGEVGCGCVGGCVARYTARIATTTIATSVTNKPVRILSLFYRYLNSYHKR